MPGSIYLRRATAADQPQIDALIRTVGINPMGLKWPRFVVADEGGRIVGAGQVKPVSYTHLTLPTNREV